MANRVYLTEIPRNPLSSLQNVRVLGNAETFPEDAVDGFGRIYQPATKTIKLNYPGSDSSGARYLDYCDSVTFWNSSPSGGFSFGSMVSS